MKPFVMCFNCDDLHWLHWKQVEADKCIIHSFRAFGHSTILWEYLLKRPSRLQAISSHFTDLVKKIIKYLQTSLWCSFGVHWIPSKNAFSDTYVVSLPAILYVSHLNYPYLVFCSFHLNLNLNVKNNRFCNAKKAYLLLHAVCWKYMDGL